MDKKIKVVSFDDSLSFDGFVFKYNCLEDKVGRYSKEKIVEFKKKMFFILERGLDVLDDFNDILSDKMDGFVDKTIDYFDELWKEFGKKKEAKSEILGDSTMSDSSKNEVSNGLVGRRIGDYKLVSMLSDEQMEKFGLNTEEKIVELKEFKKELMMANFEDNSQSRGRRGILYVWMPILIGIVMICSLIAVCIFGRYASYL